MHRSRALQNVHGRTPHVPHQKLSLLDRLIRKEKQEEESAILQCLRYIVLNNFFDPSPHVPLDSHSEADHSSTHNTPPLIESTTSVSTPNE